MIGLIKYEFFKITRLKKAYFCVFGINFLPLMVLTILGIFILKGLLYGFLGFTQQMFEKEFGTGIMGGIIILLNFFSWSAWFFQTVLVGELISKEFENKSIKLMLLMPYTRLTIYLSKMMTTILFFMFNMLVYIALCGLIGILFQKMFGLMVFNAIDYPLMAKICGAYFTINFSYIALVFLISLFARSAETTMAFTIFSTFALKAIDGTIMLFGKFQIIPLYIADFFDQYAYLKTCEVIKSQKIMEFINNPQKLELPIAFDLLWANLIYSALFLTAGYLIFKGKEEKG